MSSAPSGARQAEGPTDTTLLEGDSEVARSARLALKLTSRLEPDRHAAFSGDLMASLSQVDCSQVAGFQASLGSQLLKLGVADDLASLVSSQRARSSAEADYHRFLGQLAELSQSPASLDTLAERVKELRDHLLPEEVATHVGPRFFGLVSESLLDDPASAAINRVCLGAARQHCEENLPRGQDQHREGLAHLAVGERLKQLPLSQAAQDRVDTAVLSAMRQMLPAGGGTLARIALDCDKTDNPQPPLSGPDRQALNQFVLAELSEKPGWHSPWMDFLQAVTQADRPGPEGSSFFSRLVLESVAGLRDPAVVSIRGPLRTFLEGCPEEQLKTVWAALGRLRKQTPEPLAPAQLALDLMESCHRASQRIQVLELALSDLQSLPSPAVGSILQGIETRLAATGEPGERVVILREGLRTLLELRDDPHFKALLENQRAVTSGVQDQGPVLRIGSTFLRKRQ